MMGAHHAACGAAAWVAATTSITVPLDFIAPGTETQLGLGLMDMGPAGIITGALVCAGAALVPDADHHNATIAHSLPPVSNAVCSGIGHISGGHRHGTHSILGIAAFVALAWLTGLWTTEVPGFGTAYIGAGILSVLLVAFAAKALKIIPDSMQKSPWAVGIAAGALIAFFSPEYEYWFPMVMGLGVIVHIVGDMMTTGGCNLVWPFTIKPPKILHNIPVISSIWKPNGYFAIPILGNAGSWREWLLLVPIGAYAIGGVGFVLLNAGQTGLETLVALAAG